jgi:type II secretory pathway pseudopilin PulG
VEIAMVASVIAILALLILPLFRNRSDEAKLVAAQDELQSLAKALLLAEADTGQLFRLQDLDNGTTIADAAGDIRPDLDIPIAWSDFRAVGEIPWVTLSEVQRNRLFPPTGTSAVGASYWRGPYVSFQRSITYIELFNLRGWVFYSNGGPIYNVHPTTGGYPAPGGGLYDANEDRIPVDPWGSPYIFINLAETGYGPRLLYSMGPNGIPGNTANPNQPGPYYSSLTGGELGTGDDLQFIF